MTKYIIIIVLLASSLHANSVSRLDSLLTSLDQVVENRVLYSEQKEIAIASLKHQLTDAAVDDQRYNILGHLFELYCNYQTDSAFRIAQERVQIAEKIGRKYEIARSQMNMAEIFRTTGMYKESLEILEELKAKDLGKEDQAYFYHLYHSLYMLMGNYVISDADRKKYNALVYIYKDSILNLLNPDDLSYYLVKSSKQIMLGEFNNALETARLGYSKHDQNSPMITYTLSEIYHHLGNSEKEKEFLTLSAISDLKSGVKEYISLRKLAIILYEEGDIDRAYSYMKCSLDDAIFSNSRLRTLEVSKMLPLISDTYNLKMQEERSRLFWISAITIALALILLITSIYIYRQVKTLSSIRKYQKRTNTELKKVNDELNNINSELTDSNLIKEEYIGNLFKICSSYIDKLEDFRINVNRKIKAGQINELSRMTSSSSLVADELKEFYKNFDSIFLNIYPTFIEDFNALLDEDGKIYPKDGDLLTPELRIFALVRLGINDSVKIADFLHYSPQTIYNYRLKIRNKTSVPKDDFPAELAKIGLTKSNAPFHS